jgi:hypothetical protein
VQKALFNAQTWYLGLSVNVDKSSMVLFTNNKKLMGFKKPILFETGLQLKNQRWNSHVVHKMHKTTIIF